VALIYEQSYHASTGDLVALTGRKIDRLNKFAEAAETKRAGTFYRTEGGKRRWTAPQVLRVEIAVNAADLDGKISGMPALDLFLFLDSFGDLPFVFDDVFEPYPRGKSATYWTERDKDLWVGIWFYSYLKESTDLYPETAYGSIEKIAEKLAKCDPEISIGQVMLFNVHDAAARVQKRAREAGLGFPEFREHLGRPELIQQAE
jgi:hypothetical protein